MSVTLTGLSGLLSKAPVNVQQMRDLRDHEHLRQRELIFDWKSIPLRVRVATFFWRLSFSGSMSKNLVG